MTVTPHKFRNHRSVNITLHCYKWVFLGTRASRLHRTTECYAAVSEQGVRDPKKDYLLPFNVIYYSFILLIKINYRRKF
jgi:hypothetical protein